ncbi:MAG: VWA domain-containing protein [Vicinamibacterales bacterium]|nr:VWA domain-containing protein [Vicinamibacterales bacterium]
MTQQPSRRDLWFALAAVAVMGVGASATDTQTPSFRTGVDIVSVNVTVTNAMDRYITDLEQHEFVVYEDSVEQDLDFFTRSPLPIALALLIDTSASMERQIQTAQQAAIGFAERLRPQDLASVVDFDSRVTILEDFTNDGDRLERAIRRTAAGGSTSLYNAIYISLKELSKVRARTTDDIRRRAIVVLSDGEDTSSLVGFNEVMELAKRSETATYAIGLRAREHRGSRGFQEAEYVLQQLSRETGGRAFFPESLGELSGIYSQIADELSSQYTIGYTPKNPAHDGGWRRILVRVNRSSMTARTKQGYYAPTSP